MIGGPGRRRSAVADLSVELGLVGKNECGLSASADYGGMNDTKSISACGAGGSAALHVPAVLAVDLVEVPGDLPRGGVAHRRSISFWNIDRTASDVSLSTCSSSVLRRIWASVNAPS